MAALLLVLILSFYAPNLIHMLICTPEGHRYESDATQSLSCTGPNSKLLMADFNNDGRSDWFCNNLDTSQKDYYALATVAGTFYQKFDAGTETWCPGSSGEMMTGDVNGDGTADLICRHADGATYDVSYYERRKFSPSTKMHVRFECDYTNAAFLIGDVNADNIDDFVCVNKASGTVTVLYNYHHHRSRRHYGRTQVNEVKDQYKHGLRVSIDFCLGTTKTVHLADLNGDRAKDLVCHENSAGELSYALADRLHGFNKPITHGPPVCAGLPSSFKFVPQDFNGDNRADLGCYKTTGHDIILSDSKLMFNGLQSIGTIPLQCTQFDKIQHADVNGDRRADAICDEATINTNLEILYTVCRP